MYAGNVLSFAKSLFAPAVQHRRDVVETLMFASFFVVATRMWYVEEHVVFLSILFALGFGSLASGLTLVPRLEFGVRSLPILLLLAFAGVMLLSFFWSPEPHRTVAYAVFSVLHILIGVSIARVIRLQSLLAGIFLGSLGVGLYSAVASLARGLNPLEGDQLRGLFTNQSDLSFIVGMGVAAAIPFLGKRLISTVFFGSGALLLGLYVWHLDYLTTAVTLAAVAVVAAGLIVVRSSPVERRRKVLAGLAGIAAVAVVTLWIFRAPIQVALGKTSDFSGRVPFWLRFWGDIQERPLSGVSWGFTRDEFGGTDQIVPHQEIFPAHNGYIEIAFALGIPAAVMVAGALAVAFVVGFVGASKVNASWLAAGVPLFVTYLIVHDISGSWLPRVLGLFLMASVFGYLATRHKEEKPASSNISA